MKRFSTLLTVAILLLFGRVANAAGEISAWGATGTTVYAIVTNQQGQAWNGSAFEAVVNANWANYKIALTEQGTTGYFIATFPSGIVTAGAYSETILTQAGGSPVVGDTKIGTGVLQWTGSAITSDGKALPSAVPGASGGLITVGTGSGQLNPNGTGGLASVTTVQSGTAQAGGATTITLAAGASATDDLYKGNYVLITSATGAAQSRTITGYVGATKVATVSRAWTVNPDNTSVYAVIGNPHPALDANLAVTAGTVSDKTGYTASTVSDKTGYALAVSPPTLSQITSGILVNANNPLANDTNGRLALTPAEHTNIITDVWTTAATRTLSAFAFNPTVGGYATSQDPATLVLGATASTWNTAGTIGSKINSAASATDPWTSALPGSYASGSAGYIVGNNLNATVSSRFPTASYTTPPTVDQIAAAILITGANKINTDTSGNITVGAYAAGKDPGTMTLAANIAPGVTLKNAAAIGLSILAGTYSVARNTANKTITVTYNVPANPPNQATSMVVMVTNYTDATLTIPTGRPTISYSNLP